MAETALPEFSLWEQTQEKRIPFSFDLEVTARCNNDCRHCYINLPVFNAEAEKKELSFDEISAIADEAVSLGALWCLITGGEPLLREDFSEIYTALKKKGLLTSVFTNACRITEEHIRVFKRYPPRDIEVTVYGVTKETYEKVTRCPGSYAAFRKGLDLLLESGVKVRLKAMAIRSNVHELPEIAKFCRERTKDYFRFDPLLHLRFDGNKQRNEEILAERLPPAEIVAIEQADEERAESLTKGCNELDSAGSCASLLQSPLPLRCRKWKFQCQLMTASSACAPRSGIPNVYTTCERDHSSMHGLILCLRYGVCAQMTRNSSKSAGDARL